MTNIPSSNTALQQSNWQGAIPTIISIAPTSLSSPMAPRPIHAMISRCNYLHLALYKEVMTLANYAPFSVGSAVANHAKVGATAPSVAAATLSATQSGSMILRAEEPPDDIVNNSDDDDVIRRNKRDEEGRDHSNSQNRDEEISTGSNTNSKNHNHDNIINNDTFPECWFEDVFTGIPLRWQLFAGILYDLVKGKSMVMNNGNAASRQSRHHPRLDDNHFLPWQIRVHFTRYPHDTILALDDGGGGGIGGGCSVQHHHQPTHKSNGNGEENNILDDNSAHRRIDALISRTYRNSLKQALFLQYGTSRTAMSINKQSHEQLWDAIQAGNYEKYCEVNSGLQRGVECGPISTASSSSFSLTISGGEKKGEDDDDIPQLIPVRLLLNDLPAIQRPIRHQRRRVTVTDGNEDACINRKSTLEELMTTYQSPSYTTLGDFLADHFPHHFEMDAESVTVREKSAEDNDTYLYYCIQGIQPSLKCAMIDLWRCLSHPDHFLYVIVVKK